MVEEGGVGIRPLEGVAGVRVSDRIERRGVDLRTSTPVNPEPAGCDQFPYSVDAAVAITTDYIGLQESPSVYLYDRSGSPLDDLGIEAHRELDDGSYFIQLESSLKLYLLVDQPLMIERESDMTAVSLAESDRILLGARRHHDRPTGTITTTEDPSDVMSALSHLGSALKTNSPRRSFSSLRGHPPAIELGQELSVPDVVDKPDSGITIELPPDLSAAYVAAPLAQYLPAELVEGGRARIVTEGGFVHGLRGGRGFEAEVERVLKQTFFLDCVTREGISDRVTVEQERVADGLPFDLESVRNLSPAARLERYLDTPFGSIRDFVPKWKLVAHVEPTPERVEVVPFLTDDLAVIRTPDTPAKPPTETTSVTDGALPGAWDTSARRRGEAVDADESQRFVDVEPSNSVEQAWVGDGIPIGASKAVPEAYLNRINREPSDERLRIVVVCNDEGMLEERDAASEVYGSREDFPFDVTVYEHLTTDKFRKVLASDVDFLHYVGHIDDDGFECADGSVAASELDEVAVDSFVLNACRSYEQGLALIERGAVGGVVTLDQVLNSGAVRVGKTMARLLNRGFPLRPALQIARNRSIIGNQYLVLGDGNFDIAPSEGLGSTLARLQTTDGGYDFALLCYPNRFAGLGSVFRPAHGGPADSLYLVSSRVSNLPMDDEEIRTYLDTQVQPVLFDGELTWSDEVELEELS